MHIHLSTPLAYDTICLNCKLAHWVPMREGLCLDAILFLFLLVVPLVHVELDVQRFNA